MTRSKRILWPLGAGLAGILLLSGLYFGLVSWVESPQHAVQLFWDERWIIIPIILGFGVQAALYTILKKRLFIPLASTGSSGTMAPATGMMGAGGTTSTVAMVACCAHHVTDVLPILGGSLIVCSGSPRCGGCYNFRKFRDCGENENGYQGKKHNHAAIGHFGCRSDWDGNQRAR